MPTVTLQVTLKNGNLDVDQSGNGNQIAHGQSVTIAWHLSVPGGSSGSFNAISTDPGNSGFSWIQQPPTGVFGRAQLADNGNKITIIDNNNSTGSSGTWIYKLCATINDRPYSTIATSPTGTTSNPQIKNM